MTLDGETMIARSPTPVEATVGSEIVLMRLDSGKCYGLGETGSEVWRLIDSPTKLSAVLDALSLEYDAPRSTIEQDVVELLEELRQQGLVDLR